jgi:hypothetical protein
MSLLGSRTYVKMIGNFKQIIILNLHFEFMLHFMLHDDHVVLVTMKETMSNYCSTNMGSLMIL